MALNLTTCTSCSDRVFNAQNFPKIFIGEDYDEDGGISYSTPWDEVREAAAAGCAMCKLIQQKAIHSQPQDKDSIDVRIFGTSLGEAVYDISLLYVDLGTRGHATYSVFAEESRC